MRRDTTRDRRDLDVTNDTATPVLSRVEGYDALDGAAEQIDGGSRTDE